MNDLSDTIGPDTRVGLVHAAANVTALGLDLASLITRRNGHSELADGQHRRVAAGDAPVLLVRDRGRLYALANTGSHAGGPP